MAVVCDYRNCGAALPPPPKHASELKYCPGTNHRQMEYQARKRERDREARRKAATEQVQAELAHAELAQVVALDRHPLNVARVSPAESRDGRASQRRPPEAFAKEADFWLNELRLGRVSQQQLAQEFDTTQTQISRWIAYLRAERKIEQEREGWELSPEARRALDDFAFFRGRYFIVAREPFAGQPYRTEAFHLRWIEALLEAIPPGAGGTGETGKGGRQVILSPPRHGKTELLIHFCIWLILRNPDINIIWVSKAQDRADEAGMMIRGELETNQALIADFLGPGGTFKRRERTGAAWRDDKFSVDTRTRVQKGSTFRAFGKGGTLQSVDADLIIIDDFEDFDTTRTADQRDKNRTWLLTETSSRKERHTAWLVIGSRNHPQDALDHLLKSANWSSIVETAHAYDCEFPVEDTHAHATCMLWPEKFSYEELMELWEDSGDQIVRMRYLNEAIGDGLVVFSEELLRGCLDRSRSLGDVASLPRDQGYELLGSIDPSPGVHQAVNLWAWSRTNPARYLVDVDVGKGGMDAWQDVAARWLGVYDLRRWVVEDNSAQVDYIAKREFVKWCADEGVFIHPHTTGMNKHNQGIGIASLIPLFRNNHIVLPYGDALTRGKIDALIREFVNFDPDAPRSVRRRIDRVVCAWFANKYIDTLRGGRSAPQVQDDTPAFFTPGGLGWVNQDAAGGWL